MDVVFETSYYTLYSIPEKKCIIQRWTGSCPSDTFRETHLKSFRFFIESGYDHVVSDISVAPPLPPDDAKWAAEFMLPKYGDNGLKLLRVVKPSAVGTQHIVENLSRTGLPVQVFEDVDVALSSVG